MKLKLVLFFAITIILSVSINAQPITDTVVTLYYNSNESKLTDEHYSLLDSLLPNLKRVRKIESFADSIGSVDDNYSLSFKRAFNVGIYLLAHNLPSISGSLFKGEKHKMNFPFYKNRRVDIYCILKSTIDSLEEQKPANYSKPNIIELNLENIGFIPDMPYVNANSVGYLDPLANQLKAYNAKHIDIIGHTNVGGKFYDELSKKRAKVIYDFLLEKGLDATILSYSGIGNSKPLIQFPETDEEKKKNMRVEIIVRF